MMPFQRLRPQQPQFPRRESEGQGEKLARLLELAKRETRRFCALEGDVRNDLAGMSPDDPIRERILGVLQEGEKLTKEIEGVDSGM